MKAIFAAIIGFLTFFSGLTSARPLPESNPVHLCDSVPNFCALQSNYAQADRAATLEEIREIANNPHKYECQMLNWSGKFAPEKIYFAVVPVVRKAGYNKKEKEAVEAILWDKSLSVLQKYKNSMPEVAYTNLRTYQDELEQKIRIHLISYAHPAVEYTLQFRKNDKSPEVFFALTPPFGTISRGKCSLK